MKQSISLVLLGAVLALGFTIAAHIVSTAVVRVANSETIRVKGSASKSVKSDFGTWTGSINVTMPSMSEGLERLDRDVVKAHTFIEAAGFTLDEISDGDIGVSKNFKIDDKGRQTNQILNYTLSRSITVSSKKVDELEILSRTFTNLLREGVYTFSQTPCFVITTLDNYKLELLSDATANGRSRAEILAKKTGGKVGALVNASQGIFQVMAPGSSDISDYGTYDKSTVMKEIKAVVTLEFRAE